ncbi:PLP-dependent aminotransferase family protein [uncultured Adlercreutzia sp.]|uniref:MocR-like pyridoxine biosynthesis transcription factor PdxR n=1 Tax=uncultured Adlercreutzia sp. TaxID=875803 RepID=UPI0026F3DDBC|nr:PLP-dependent aminotransferase family protein [uncultured Adlercreutzia sp.]
MLTYELGRGAGESLYEQLYRALRCDMEHGVLAAGERLPSKRALAQHLGVSVITVEGAYRQLVAEGYVRAVPRSGYYVQPNAFLPGDVQLSGEAMVTDGRNGSEGPRKEPDEQPNQCESGENGPSGQCRDEGSTPLRPLVTIFRSEGDTVLADFTGASAPEGVFPYAAWARTMRVVLSDENEGSLRQASGPQGSLRLREAIAAHLRGSRGMQVSPDQIVVGSGAQSLYGIIVQLLGRDKVYGVEDPGYPRLTRIYRANDVSVATVPLDEEGPVPEALSRAGVQVLHCMPSHQFPTGLTTPVGRRVELLAWAVSCEGRFLIEDDFDCEFRMEGRPMPTLASLDGIGRVIYVNTFTKTLGAAFRIGYVVLPPALASRFRDELGFYACSVGALEQLTLARFMEAGDYERHVNRQRTHFRRVLQRVVEGLQKGPGAPWMRLRNQGSGLHFLLEITGGGAGTHEVEERVAQAAAREGVLLAPLGQYRLGAELGGRSEVRGAYDLPAFVMSFAGVPEERAEEAGARVSKAVAEVCCGLPW